MKIKSKLDVQVAQSTAEVVDKTDDVSYLYLRQGEADVVWLSKSINPSQS